MAARVARQLGQQVVDDAADPATAIALGEGQQLGVQGDAHRMKRLVVTLGVVSDHAGWPARRSTGGDAAAWVAGALLFVALAALVFGGSREPGLAMVALCVVGAVLGAAAAVLLVWAIGYRRLRYVLTDTALRIDWAGRTTVVPYSAIQGIYTGQRLSGNAAANRLRWPGINVGAARVRGLGRLRFFATSTDQSALMFITVEHGGVILSPRDAPAFRAALIDHVERSEDVGERRIWHQTPPTEFPWTALNDAWLPVSVGLGTLVLLLVLAVIAVRFDVLPDQIVMHFEASGRPSLITTKFDLLRLPTFGLVCLLLNWAIGVWVHPRDVLLARLLWLGAALVQVVLLVGVLRLVA
jgi:hypothetical protein